MGMIFAHFHMSGKMLLYRDKLINFDNEGAIELDASFNIFGLIPSGPVALFVLSDFVRLLPELNQKWMKYFAESDFDSLAFYNEGE